MQNDSGFLHLAGRRRSRACQSQYHRRPDHRALPVAYVLCNFSTWRYEPNTLSCYQDEYTQQGALGKFSSLADYFDDESYGRMDMAGSNVPGWLDMSINTVTFASSTNIQPWVDRVNAAAASGRLNNSYDSIVVFEPWVGTCRYRCCASPGDGESHESCHRQGPDRRGYADHARPFDKKCRTRRLCVGVGRAEPMPPKRLQPSCYRLGPKSLPPSVTIPTRPYQYRLAECASGTDRTSQPQFRQDITARAIVDEIEVC
jgi:hypothetical protein